ncbi:DUF6300 family protein [Streptomyces mirabilis]|uniref:DUF6300 family protein n=1 Tax=Streptomyces mirabilis TaxID=68239 RepID=UPI0036DBE9BB
MALLEFSDRLPQCSRCRGDLIMSGVAPQDDEHGRPIQRGRVELLFEPWRQRMTFPVSLGE